ncbi:zinc ribbon domain-containing protein [Ectothiorhodospiraceae bacterium WFHF3C12]|nr:zinc ribbon domain-containing protein [Ectothiorhodospiraceae bacterium WFHF3C12]
MPIYEYKCDKCDHELEAIQSISDEPLTDCPSCGESKLRKLISAAGFRLKGGGWYETDFKSRNKRNIAGENASTSSSTSSSGESGSSSGSSKSAADG